MERATFSLTGIPGSGPLTVLYQEKTNFRLEFRTLLAHLFRNDGKVILRPVGIPFPGHLA